MTTLQPIKLIIFSVSLMAFFVVPIHEVSANQTRIDSTLNARFKVYEKTWDDFKEVEQKMKILSDSIFDQLNAYDKAFGEQVADDANWEMIELEPTADESEYLVLSPDGEAYPKVNAEISGAPLVGGTNEEISSWQEFITGKLSWLQSLFSYRLLSYTSTALVDFYGQNLAVDYNSGLQIKLGAINANNKSEKISTALSTLNEEAEIYQSVIKQWVSIATIMNLSEWGFILLVDQTSRELFKQKNERNFFTWFMLNHSGLRCHIGEHQGTLYLLFPTQAEVGIYNTTFTKELGEYTYYLYDFDQPNNNIEYVNIYKSSYETAKNVINSFSELPNFRHKADIFKKFNFKIKEQNKGKESIKNKNLTIAIDQNMVNYLNDVPSTQLKEYFNAKLSSQLLVPRLKEMIKNDSRITTDIDKLKFLFEFVQTAFTYKADQRPNFPDQTLNATLSDCEDRSILFKYLVEQITHFKIIALVYNDHVATAYQSENKEADQKAYNYKGETYIVCDPTAKGAKIGEINSKYSGAIPNRVIE